MGHLTTHTRLSPIRRGFAPGFVNYKKGCTRLAAASDKVYQLLAHGRWFSPGTSASSTTKTGRHDIAEILLKVALNTINQPLQKISIIVTFLSCCDRRCILRPRTWRGVLDTTLCDKVYQRLVAGRWFSPGTPLSAFFLFIK